MVILKTIRLYFYLHFVEESVTMFLCCVKAVQSVVMAVDNLTPAKTPSNC